ncbi:hypothetical protein [Sphingomonas desiccabilis]|uniref:Uncharacterized protein n=1 Tax=Sphingomonas desiccabilis TaxID=429134 RepID=A0A4Q2IUL8_9SPHN|nr:hypothetical protein [Sphingomonas desiccabilis]MBB3909465.1 hypothetical protein [Sphingomonas desiccabilis]RXZ34205.1 hypothetical protein EO081_00335 [Sphingomonas desiccabilis]
MEALAETLLALAPDANAVGTPTLATLRAKDSPIRWIDAPSSAEETLRNVGRLAGGTVLAPNAGMVPELTFEWDGPPGHPFGFDPVQALRSRGFQVKALYCSAMVSEGTNYFLVAAPGKRQGFLAVYAFDAPMAISVASWSIRYRLDGHIPSLAEVQADEDVEASTDCSKEVFGPVEQISHAEAEAFVRSKAPATRSSR